MAGRRRASPPSAPEPSLSRVAPAPPDGALAEPPCPQFGRCGGCSLQHWTDPAVAAWKAARVATALSRAGLDATVPPALTVPPATRRRVDLAIRRLPSGVALGLHGVEPSDIVPLDPCRVLHPRLLALLPGLRGVLDRLSGLRREGSAVLNLLDTGPDLLLRHDAAVSPQDRQRLAAFAAGHGIPRIAVARRDGWEIACQHGPASIAFAGVSVAPPPGAFLQAAAAGEAAIVAAVLAGLPPRRTAKSRIAELYAGCGTLTFPLARQVRVAAFEGDADAAAALADAARRAGAVTATRRDLARQPLSAAELAGFAAVILDPPFAGAGPQIAPVAASGVRRVIYVSCNPAALARDAAALAAAGYRVAASVAIDQFRWSPHVESVITFER